MKVTLTNIEIEGYINIINNKDSFRNNLAIKVPTDLAWNLRLNIKKLNEYYVALNEMREELGKEFIEAGKVDDNKVKPEFLSEYNDRLVAIMLQKNEIELRPLKLSDYKEIKGLSMPERDFLMYMIEDIDDQEMA